MTTRTRYFLLQLPSWFLAAVLLVALHTWAGLPLWVAAVAWVLYVAKDFALYPKLRRAYETEEPSGAAALVGQLAVVKQPLEPEGYVQISGELWRARSTDGRHILRAAQVRVVGADGITLTVRSDEPSAV